MLKTPNLKIAKNSQKTCQTIFLRHQSTMKISFFWIEAKKKKTEESCVAAGQFGQKSGQTVAKI
jgi:hypothetical protein